jgi:pilus assembly protein Flp/PilA
MRLRISSRQEGQGLVEYALILVLIAVAVLLTVTLLGQRINMVFAQILLQMEHPGVYSGPPLSVSDVGLSVGKTCSAGECVLLVDTATAFGGTSVSDPICVRFSVSGGGSKTVCGSPPATDFTGAPDSPGEVTACVVGVENHTLTGGETCQSVSY